MRKNSFLHGTKYGAVFGAFTIVCSLFYGGLYVYAWPTLGLAGRLITAAFVLLAWSASEATALACVWRKL